MRGALGPEHAADPVREAGQAEGLVSGYVPNRVASAQIELGQRHAIAVPHRGHEPDQPGRGQLIGLRLGELRTDMAMQADELELGVGEHLAHRVGRVP